MSGNDSLKRILALSGGGVRGVVEVAFLEAVEAAYKRRFGEGVKLSDVFHLVGGTSTGALIATAIALDLPLDTIRNFYLDRAEQFFQRRRFLSWLQFRAAFDSEALESEIKRIVGDTKLGDPALQTYLAIVTKRLDTGSPWIVTNVPSAPYFEDPEDKSFRGNKHYSVAKLLTASAAAPTYFDQRSIEISLEETGVFVDGGLSPHSDPSLALLKIARLGAFGLSWPTGAQQMFVLSIGTGRYRSRLNTKTAAQLGSLPLAYYAMRGMVNDSEIQTQTMMQWLGTSKRPSSLNSEIGSLENDNLAVEPVFSYLKLDLPLDRDSLEKCGLRVSKAQLKRFQALDDPTIIRPIYKLAQQYIDVALDLDDLLSES